MNLIRLPAVLFAAALLTLAGCGGDEQEPEVATAATGGARPQDTVATAGTVEEYVEGVRAYARCMRENGVADFPDPGPKGETKLGDLSKRKSDPTFISAAQTCKNLHPPMPAELRGQGQKLTAEQIANAREYAACMRANGVPDFRDPGPDGQFRREDAQPADERQAAATLRAGQICEPVLNGQPTASAPAPNTGVG